MHFRGWIFYCSLGVLLLVAFPVEAQDFKKDFEKILSAYNTKQLSINAVYKLYQNSTTDVPVKVDNGQFVKNGTATLSVIASIETLVTDKYIVNVYHDSKTIQVYKNKGKGNESAFPYSGDSIFMKSVKIEFVKLGDSVHGYHLEGDFYTYERIDLYFEPHTYKLSKMVLFQKKPMRAGETSIQEKPRLEIIYTPGTTSNVQALTEKKYVEIKGDMAVCQSAYKNYKLLNHLAGK
jgi:hypothetical protein